jgi:alkylation response protein AidB-like acyl-CoA dehydrogenase
VDTITLPYSDEERHWVAKARELAQGWKERTRRYDEAGEYPAENMAELRDGGVLKLAVPAEYGGLGTNAGWCAAIPHLVVEEVASACANTGWCLLTHFHHCGILAGLGNEQQCERVFGAVVRDGALLGSLGSEVNPHQAKAAPNTGQKLTFNANFEPVDGGFRANAFKGFCSLGSVADYLFYWAIAPGMSNLQEGLVISLVPQESEGLTFVSGWEEAIGLRGSLSGGAKLENVFIPWENVLGQPGDWVQKHRYAFELTYAVELNGISRGVMDFVRQVLADRPYLMDDDTVPNMVGEMYTELQAARTSWWYAQRLWDDQRYDEAAYASWAAQHKAKTAAMFITSNAFDVVGARALFKFNPLDRAWRDAKTVVLHSRESAYMRMITEGAVSGQLFSKQKYGDRVTQRTTWADLGLEEARNGGSRLADVGA